MNLYIYIYVSIYIYIIRIYMCRHIHLRNKEHVGARINTKVDFGSDLREPRNQPRC